MYFQRKCRFCGKVFETKRYPNQFCSQSCYFKSKRAQRNAAKDFAGDKGYIFEVEEEIIGGHPFVKEINKLGPLYYLSMKYAVMHIPEMIPSDD